MCSSTRCSCDGVVPYQQYALLVYLRWATICCKCQERISPENRVLQQAFMWLICCNTYSNLVGLMTHVQKLKRRKTIDPGVLFALPWLTCQRHHHRLTRERNERLCGNWCDWQEIWNGEPIEVICSLCDSPVNLHCYECLLQCDAYRPQYNTVTCHEGSISDSQINTGTQLVSCSVPCHPPQKHPDSVPLRCWWCPVVHTTTVPIRKQHTLTILQEGSSHFRHICAIAPPRHVFPIVCCCSQSLGFSISHSFLLWRNSYCRYFLRRYRNRYFNDTHRWHGYREHVTHLLISRGSG